MAEICCGVVAETEETISRAARRRRIDLRRSSTVSGVSPLEETVKRRRFESPASENETQQMFVNQNLSPAMASSFLNDVVSDTTSPKFGMASVCGRRRDMEDSVAIHPSFCRRENEETNAAAQLHYFGVYDGHGCSHVATKCRDRMHEVVKEEVLLVEIDNDDDTELWKSVMERSFVRMDKEAVRVDENGTPASCRCELQTPACENVGSTAVVAVVSPRYIVVANCGDSRAVLCRKGIAVPLSDDHKPDRPDEMNRIQAAGGRVIFWEGARVGGVLAMSRAIGDTFLKPFVSCEPEVTITGRTEEDECLILASDGLWDVVSNETACGVARMCLKGKAVADSPENGSSDDRACSDAAMLLTKLALARRSADNVSVVVIDLRKPKAEVKNGI